LLADEMTERALASYLEKMGHDVERVVAVPTLGPGTDDDRIVSYADAENRLLVTYDDDFLTARETLDRIGVLFQPNSHTDAFDTANVINEISTYVDQEAVVAHDEAFHLTDRWLTS
jgi:hypothetical protein